MSERKNVWDEFDKAVDNDQLRKDIENAAENKFPEVPEGTYRVKVEKMEPTVSKSGKPMCSIRFRILQGQYRKCMIFYNQVVEKARGIHSNNEFLRSLDLDCVNDQGDHLYKNFGQYADLIMDAAEEIDEYGLTYDLYYPGRDAWSSDCKIKGVHEED